jgi:LAO/AO transport system kinase
MSDEVDDGDDDHGGNDARADETTSVEGPAPIEADSNTAAGSDTPDETPPVAGAAPPDGASGVATQPELVTRLLDGDHRALARAITRIENRASGYRDLVAALHRHAGGATVVGVTGSPGAGKSTLVDKLAEAYRDRGLTVGVVAVDPSSPYTGGSVLGDRIRMSSTVGDMDVFFRSMSARGQLGGLATATDEAVTALSAFGKDIIIIETVGAGQNEVDVVRTAETVAVLVQPGSGDDVQTLKAGILEIGDVFVVNKADLEGTDRTVAELEEMVHARVHGTGRSGRGLAGQGHHGPDVSTGAQSPGQGSTAVHESDRSDGDADAADESDASDWVPPVIETVATTGDGVEELLTALADHRAHIERTGELTTTVRGRYAEQVRRVLREDLADLVEQDLEHRGGLEAVAAAVADRDTDPYTLADELLAPVRTCLERTRVDDADSQVDADDPDRPGPDDGPADGPSAAAGRDRSHRDGGDGDHD